MQSRRGKQALCVDGSLLRLLGIWFAKHPLLRELLLGLAIEASEEDGQWIGVLLIR